MIVWSVVIMDELKFEDEFEEFRARANSGGMLPYKKKKQTDRLTKSVDTLDITSNQQDPIISYTVEQMKEFDHAHFTVTIMDNQVSKSQSEEYMLYKRYNMNMDIARLKISEDDEWFMGDPRPRVRSMPSYYRNNDISTAKRELMKEAKQDKSNEFHKVRSFAITKKGVVSEGDVYLGRKIQSLNSLDTGSTFVSFSNHISNCSSPGTGGTCTTCSTESDLGGRTRISTVIVCGNVGVGKSTLIGQFITSEHGGLATSFGKYNTLI